jgi:hypothetical protein
MSLLRWPVFPALRQMASRLPSLPRASRGASMGQEAVLLTPLESLHPRLLPSSHRINRVHPVFCKKQPFSFHALAGTHFATLLFSISCRNGGYPASRQKSCSIFGQEKGLSVPLSLLDATLTRHPISVHSKRLTENLTPLDATLTKNRGREAHRPPQSFIRVLPYHLPPVPNWTDDYTLPRIYNLCAILPSLRSGNRAFLPRWRSS